MDLPAHLSGFITKQQVAALFPISERTVQRHISSLIRQQDRDALQHLALVTDDETRIGTEVTFELIEELNRNGQKPRWYLRPTYAESVFGAKPEPPPYPSPPSRPVASPAPSPAVAAEQGSSVPSPEPQSAFLIDRINSLEQQMQEERQRHDQLIAKLFAQLEVKDKQISAWDEVTQGLTKALATGQLTPDFSRILPIQASPSKPAPSGPSPVAADASRPPAEDRPTTEKPAEPVIASTDESPPQTPKPATKARRPKSKPPKPPMPESSTPPGDPSPKWWQMPTFHKVFSRRRDR